MTHDDFKYDPDDLDTSVTYYQRLQQRVTLIIPALVATVGLFGYTVAQYPTIPIETSIPHLLALSILLIGAGAGAFSLLFMYYFDPIVQLGGVAKMSSVYVTVLVLITLFVDAGTFHPRLALVFLTLLAGTGVLFTLFRNNQSGMITSV